MNKDSGFYDIKGIGQVSKSYLGIDDRTRLAFNSAGISLRDCISDGYICNISGEDASKLSSKLGTSLMTLPEYGLFLRHLKNTDPKALEELSKTKTLEILAGSCIYGEINTGSITGKTIPDLIRNSPIPVDFTIPSDDGTYANIVEVTPKVAIFYGDIPFDFRNDSMGTGNRIRMREVIRN